jgi:ornithine--oxo-acid transaminase
MTACTPAASVLSYDENGDEYLDLLSGWGVFAIGRNHPKVKAALQDVLTRDLPDLVQFDVSLLAGLLAERILRFTPGDICKLFFCNSGAEAVEAAIKASRYTTKRSKIVYLEHCFHGLLISPSSRRWH